MEAGREEKNMCNSRNRRQQYDLMNQSLVLPCLKAGQEMRKAEKMGRSQVTQGPDVKQRHLNFPCSGGSN